MTALTLVALLLLGAPPRPPTDTGGSRASPDPSAAEAKTHYKKAEKLYKQAQYTEAIAEFEAAYRIRPHGVLFFNIGKCHEQLGDIPRALRNYRLYLHDVRGAKDHDLVAAAIANLERRLRERGVQQLLVYSQPPLATVMVDGRDHGPAPVAVELAPGAHKVAVSLAGYQTAERDFSMPADRSLEMDLALGVAAPAPPSVTRPPLAVAPPLPAPPPPVSVVEAPAPADVPAPPSPARKGRLWTYLAVGAAGAGAAAGIGLGLGANAARHELLASTHPKGVAQELYDTAAGRAGGANAAYAAAAVMGVAAAVLFFLEPRWGAPPPGTAASDRGAR